MSSQLTTYKRAKKEAGDWEGYLLMFGSHERLAALSEIADQIDDDEQYWRCVGDTWYGDDAPGVSEDEWRYLLTDPFSQVWSGAMMTEAEREVLHTLPDPVPVFRGFNRKGGERGFAWTLNRETADWFATTFHGSARIGLFGGVSGDAGPRVAVGSVAKRSVIAYLDGRDEAEVLVLPEDVTLARVD